MHESNHFIFIVMELAKAGNLEMYSRYRELKFSPITDSEYSCIMKQVFLGIDYIHRLHIIHRDLKPKNILLNSFTELEGAIIIADFGLGMKAAFSTDKCGTLIYMAPEQLIELPYREVRAIKIIRK